MIYSDRMYPKGCDTEGPGPINGDSAIFYKLFDSQNNIVNEAFAYYTRYYDFVGSVKMTDPLPAGTYKF